MGKKGFVMFFLMACGAAVALAILDEEWLWWIVAFIFGFIGYSILEEMS